MLSDNVAGRCDSIQTVHSAEVEFWKEVAIRMQRGHPFGKAMDLCKNDALLWTRMIYHRTAPNRTPNANALSNKGTGKKGGNWTNNAEGWNAAGKKGGGKKGDGKGAYKGAGAGKGATLPPLDPDVVANMATTAVQI